MPKLLPKQYQIQISGGISPFMPLQLMEATIRLAEEMVHLFSDNHALTHEPLYGEMTNGVIPGFYQ